MRIIEVPTISAIGGVAWVTCLSDEDERQHQAAARAHAVDTARELGVSLDLKAADPLSKDYVEETKAVFLQCKAALGASAESETAEVVKG